MGGNFAMAQEIALRCAAAGGRAYYVGGMVRDRLLGREAEDIDLEIHGIAEEALDKLLSELGGPCGEGLSFGIRSLSGYDIDIALPRREKAVGKGHRDFAASIDPFMGTEEAASRRDFTINAMMEDVLTGEIVDHFGGQVDLRRRVLRHVSGRHFSEDPLRVLRGAGFAARFGLEAAPETAELMSRMDLTVLPGERVLAELMKAFSGAERPSLFFEMLRSVRQLRDWFPELLALIGIEQDPEHHPEGDVWTHTMRTLDGAARMREEAQVPEGLLFAALSHDFGKALVTARTGGRVHAFGHEDAGAAPAERMLGRLGVSKKLAAYVIDMVKHHMAPAMYVRQRSHVKAYMKLFDESVCPEDLLLLSGADREAGRDAAADPRDGTDEVLRGMLSLFREREAAPGVTGRDLQELGFEPGPEFRETLLYARKLKLNGIGREEALRHAAGYLRQCRRQS